MDPRALYGLSLRALVLALRGDLPEAVRDLEVIEASPHAEVRAGRDDHLYRIARAIVCLERFDTRGAQAHLDVLRPHLATLETRPVVATVQAYVDLVSFEPALGIERLRRYIESSAGAGASPRATSTTSTTSAGCSGSRAPGRRGALVAQGRPGDVVAHLAAAGCV